MVIEMKRRTPLPKPVECVQRARTLLKDVIELLITPAKENVQDCATLLEEAMNEIGAMEYAIREGPVSEDFKRMLATDVHALRRDLQCVNALLAQAATFHHGWAQILGTACGGYGSNGRAFEPPVVSSVSFEG